MWYFTWILGLAFACAFGILNAMWLELSEDDCNKEANTSRPVKAPLPERLEREA